MITNQPTKLPTIAYYAIIHLLGNNIQFDQGLTGLTGTKIKFP
jgi:hypothetical protein